MFEKVLVPTDFSKYSQKVLECVGGLPGVKEVVLLNVIGPSDPLARVWDPGARLEEAKEKLSEQAKMLEAQGLVVTLRAEAMLEGEIDRKIHTVGDEEGISLIVMGAKGKSLVEGIFLGNVAKKSLRYGDKHLLLMRYKILEGGEEMEEYCSRIFAKALCPVDFSEPSNEAINFIKTIDGIDEIVLLYVVSRGESKEEIDTQTHNATEKLNTMKEDIEKAGIKASVQVKVGSPAEVISDVADDEDVSVVVMSSHGRGWIKQLIVGSVTYEVAKNGNRPVLVVRAGKVS